MIFYQSVKVGPEENVIDQFEYQGGTIIGIHVSGKIYSKGNKYRSILNSPKKGKIGLSKLEYNGRPSVC
jgi:hypothetical protein